MDAARLLEKLDNQWLTLFAQSARLIVRPGNLLTANDETLIREHKPELMRLARLRDAGEALYSDGRMVNVLGRRYLAARAPRTLVRGSGIPSPQTTP